MDFQTLADDLSLDYEDFIELAELFVSTASSDINKLEEAYSKKDSNGMSEASHSLKGASANLGFTEIATVANYIEQNTTKETDNIEKKIKELKKMVETINQQVNSI